jgi:sodium-dependent dicarboxylate transporter 2/3/5
LAEDEGLKMPPSLEDDQAMRPSALWVDIEGPTDFLYRVYINRTFRKLIPGIIIFFIILLLPRPDDLSLEGQRALALFVFIVYLWVTETFPLPVTAFMAGVGLLLLGVYTGDDKTLKAFSPYAADAVFMVLGSLILAQGLVSSGGDRIIARTLLNRFAESTYRLLAGIILMSALISAVIPGHSVAAFMLPVVYSIITATDIKGKANEVVAMIIAIAMGCEVGSLATPSGGARNAIAIEYMRDFFEYQVTYLEWVELALPITMIMIPVTFVVVILVFKVKNRKLTLTAKAPEPGETGLRPYLGLGILGGTVVMFLLFSDVLSLGAVAMIGGILMFVFGLLRWESARGELRWGVIFIYGAALTMGEALFSTGAAAWLADTLLGGLEGYAFMAFLTVIIIVAALFTNIMSDAATVAILLPIVLPVFILNGLNGDSEDLMVQRALITSVATAIASGFAYITVFGTPPNTIVHASGMVTSKDFLKGGIVLWVVSMVVMLLIVNTYWAYIL